MTDTTQCELEESEERYRMLVESSSDAIVLLQDGAVTFVNRSALHLLRASQASEVLGRSVLEFFDPMGRDRMRQRLSALARSRGSISAEDERLVGVDGSLHDVNIAASSYRNRGEMMVQAIFRDCSEHKRMKSSLEESEMRLRLAIDAASMGNWDIDLKTDSALLSPRALSILGFPPGSAVKFHQTIEMVHPEDAAAVSAAMTKAREERGLYRVEYRLLRHDNHHTVWVLAAGRYLYAENGTPERFVGIFFDISPLKRSEHEIRHFNAVLEEKVSRRTAALELANRELDAFSYSVSHDLRAPLRAIAGFAQILDEEHHDDWSGESRNYLGRIVNAANRMSRLIDDLLSLSRVSRQEIKHQFVDLAPMAREIAADLQASEPARTAEFSFRDHLHVQGDPALLRIVLQNLMANAWKFSSTRELTRIEVGQGTEEEPSAIFVRDNGCGFDMTYAGKLFQPFHRLHSVAEYPGTGIGLATVQRIVTRHRGRAWAESKPDEGTTFYFTLWTL